jgi:hypothetical protein|tara:strand:- start:789 stop:1007 length:219 start_codon:yes stop_codon:yes gene_type:complete
MRVEGEVVDFRFTHALAQTPNMHKIGYPNSTEALNKSLEDAATRANEAGASSLHWNVGNEPRASVLLNAESN